MYHRSCLTAIICVVFLFASIDRAFAAAQLRAGATTSAQPTATSPQLRQIQITFDPDIVEGSSNATYNVTSFQLSVKFDPTKVSVASSNDVQLVSPFGNPVVSESSVTPASSTFSSINNTTGFVNFIGGSTSLAQSSPGDVNIFSIVFTLNANTNFNDLIAFTIFGDPAPLGDSESPDFITGTDPITGLTKTSYGSEITPTTIVDSFDGYTAQVSSSASPATTPLPAGIWTGAMLIAMLAAFGMRKFSLTAA